jgi:hypothetical protein
MSKLTPLVKGIITGVLMVLTTLTLYYSKLPPASPLHYFVYIVYAAGITWTLLSYKRSDAFSGKFGDLFGQGFRCFIVTILIMVAFTYVFSKMHPEFAEEGAEYYRAELVKEKNKTPAEIDTLVTQAKKQYTTGIIYFTIFGYLIIGTVITAAGSALLMRRN